jgi:hypothetical protein
MRLPALRRKRSPAPAEITRVYTREGRIAHLRLNDVVLCPFGIGATLGAGSDEEREYAAVLPLCKFCADALAETGGGVT